VTWLPLDRADDASEDTVHAFIERDFPKCCECGVFRYSQAGPHSVLGPRGFPNRRDVSRRAYRRPDTEVGMASNLARALC